MFTKTAIIAALVGLSSATPAKRFTNYFQADILAGGTHIQHGSIRASGERLFINKEAAAYCEPEIIDCSTVSNATTFFYNPATTGINLNVLSPGGQEVYVTNTGELGYTRPHTLAIPELAKIQGFQYTPQLADGTVGSLTFENQGFDACPTGEKSNLGQDVYQLFARSVAGHTGCIAVTVATGGYTGLPAWAFKEKN
ncbi:hypothetical protein WAI453_007935 [Rhynchosporium graminicola]|uniref:Cell wall protein PhiA n=1 Tax=Rhynchosporium graminicola TaxID=2792576 RepID=A0A1E1KUN2_9HELO|nr:uncharacterized protein RCO7_03591 [Rhynchosporium commune]